MTNVWFCDYFGDSGKSGNKNPKDAKRNPITIWTSSIFEKMLLCSRESERLLHVQKHVLPCSRRCGAPGVHLPQTFAHCLE